MEEERRLAYVAVTRAKRTLVLSHSHRRYGRAARPSRFIAEALCAPGGSAAA
jgi:DNA helicase-2/ATP-dependent DNA helicase PcrA